LNWLCQYYKTGVQSSVQKYFPKLTALITSWRSEYYINAEKTEYELPTDGRFPAVKLLQSCYWERRLVILCVCYNVCANNSSVKEAIQHLRCCTWSLVASHWIIVFFPPQNVFVFLKFKTAVKVVLPAPYDCSHVPVWGISRYHLYH
jgi:hypothetical protein